MRILRGSYLDLLKKATVTGEKAPDFDDYLVPTIRELVARKVKYNGYASAPPGKEDDLCFSCRERLVYSPEDAVEPLYCRTCARPRVVACPVCGQHMGKLPPRMLQCTSCGYRLEFEHELKRESGSLNEYLTELLAGRTSPEPGEELCFVQRLPDGSYEYTPLTITPGRFPEHIMHHDRKFTLPYLQPEPWAKFTWDQGHST